MNIGKMDTWVTYYPAEITVNPTTGQEERTYNSGAWEGYAKVSFKEAGEVFIGDAIEGVVAGEAIIRYWPAVNVEGQLLVNNVKYPILSVREGNEYGRNTATIIVFGKTS